MAHLTRNRNPPSTRPHQSSSIGDDRHRWDCALKVATCLYFPDATTTLTKCRASFGKLLGTMMTAVARIQALLGGELVTGPLHNERDIVRLIRRGVPTQAVDHFLSMARLSFNALDPQILNRRTFKRRQLSAEPLDQAESDRLLRMVVVVASAEETFGDSEKAHVWLNRQNRALDGETPLGMADTDQGARAVEALLGRIAHGIAA